MKRLHTILEIAILLIIGLSPVCVGILHIFETFYYIKLLVLLKYLILLAYTICYFISYSYPSISAEEEDPFFYIEGTLYVYLSVFVLLFLLIQTFSDNFYYFIYQRFSILETTLISCFFIILGLISLNKITKELALNPNYLTFKIKSQFEHQSAFNLVLSSIGILVPAILSFLIIPFVYFFEPFVSLKFEIKIELTLILIFLVLLLAIVAFYLYSETSKLYEKITKNKLKF
jgi:hypothetical protein